MKTIVTPLGCARCDVPRRRHDDTDHRYQVPDMDLIQQRADELKAWRAAA